MSTIFPVDHHATFQGWAEENAAGWTASRGWSSRKSVGFILISALASWVLVLSPLLLFT